MPEGLLERVVAEAGVPDLIEILSERLAPTDLLSLLLEVHRLRAARLSPADVLARFEADRFCRPAAVDPAAVVAFETLAWSALPEGFQAVELSPICPLGSNSVVAAVDQHKVLSTIRNSEVVADSTSVLALEAARRRRRSRRGTVDLAASQRQVRAQKFGDPHSGAHFRILALVSAGRDRGSLAFEAESLVTHIGYLVGLLLRHDPACQPEVAITDLCGREPLWQETVAVPLTRTFAGLSVRPDPDRRGGRGYYRHVCFKIYIGDRFEVGDGGCVDWTQRLLSDAKERFVTSCLGVDRILSRSR
jgi:hypothetical protein